MKEAIAYIDGSGNSGRMHACAAVIYVGAECHKRIRLLPPHTTNNVGEYSGLLLAISVALELDVEVLHIRSDSKLIVHQTRGEWKCKDHRLLMLRDQARELAQKLQKVDIQWIPREENTEADKLCRDIVKSAESSPDNPFLRVR